MKGVAEEAKRMFGHYQPGWARLAGSTMERRERAGYAPDEPLLMTGDLRDSVIGGAEGLIGYVGSGDPKARFSELGTSHEPPRPVFALALTRRIPEIVEALNAVAGRLISG